MWRLLELGLERLDRRAVFFAVVVVTAGSVGAVRRGDTAGWLLGRVVRRVELLGLLLLLELHDFLLLRELLTGRRLIRRRRLLSELLCK